MKKYAYGTQMNTEGIQSATNVLIKRQRLVREISFRAPDNMIFTHQFLSNGLLNLQQPIYHQGIEKLL